MGRRPKNELQALADAARAQLHRANVLGKSLDERMKMKREASEQWTPDEDFRRDFASITTTIRDAGGSLLRALEGRKKDLGNLTEEQLAAQFQAEIVNAAQSLTDEDWRRMCEARQRAGK